MADTPGYLFSGDRNWGDTYIVDLIIGGLAGRGTEKGDDGSQRRFGGAEIGD